MKHFFPVILLLGLSLAASAQQALGPGSGLVSPEINPDHSVTFRYHNPKAKVFAYGPNLYFMACGKADGVMANTKRLKEWLDLQGFPSTLYESEGGHIWRNWRDYLTRFAQLLFRPAAESAPRPVRQMGTRVIDEED